MFMLAHYDWLLYDCKHFGQLVVDQLFGGSNSEPFVVAKYIALVEG